MATKSKTVFVCGECGYETPKWVGKCPGCGEYACAQCMSEGLCPKCTESEVQKRR